MERATQHEPAKTTERQRAALARLGAGRGAEEDLGLAAVVEPARLVGAGAALIDARVHLFRSTGWGVADVAGPQHNQLTGVFLIAALDVAFLDRLSGMKCRPGR